VPPPQSQLPAPASLLQLPEEFRTYTFKLLLPVQSSSSDGQSAMSYCRDWKDEHQASSSLERSLNPETFAK